MEQSPVDMLIEELGRQVGAKAIEAANWKAQAMLLQKTLDELKASIEGGEPALSLVKDESKETEDE